MKSFVALFVEAGQILVSKGYRLYRFDPEKKRAKFFTVFLIKKTLFYHHLE